VGGQDRLYGVRAGFGDGSVAMSSNGILFTIAIAAFVAFVAYRRVRRTIGRQRVTPRRFVLRASILVLVGCVIFVTLLMSFTFLELGEVFVGIGLGVALGFYGLRRTEFEVGEDALYYVPNPYLGVVISALLIGRIAYSFAFNALSGNSPLGTESFDQGAQGTGGFQQSYDPVSSTLLFLFIGYYVTYYAGLLLRSRRLSKDSSEP
jgi:hypothetical protein